MFKMKSSTRNSFTVRPFFAAAAIAGLLISSPLFAQEKPKEQGKKEQLRDLDKELDQLEKTKANLQKQLSKDWKKAQEEMMRSLNEIDLDKAHLQAQEALQRIDFDAIQRQVTEAIENSAKASEHISKEMVEKMKLQIEKAKKEHELAQQKHEKHVKEEIERAKKQIAESKEKIKLDKLDIEKSLRHAEESIDKAKAEVKSYQDMIYAMEADGLLDTKKDYTIRFKDGKLTINGNEQPETVTNKYRKYFKKDSVTLKKENGTFDLLHD
jgi:DNA repair exonuclease SbcCD ATPase subunit